MNQAAPNPLPAHSPRSPEALNEQNVDRIADRAQVPGYDRTALIPAVDDRHRRVPAAAERARRRAELEDVGVLAVVSSWPELTALVLPALSRRSAA